MATEESLDDRLWQIPPEFGPWLDTINSQWGFPPGVNAENVHLIFAASPFCSLESANKRFEVLVNKKPELSPSYFEREKYERELKDFPGEAFFVVEGPKTSADVRKNGEGVNLLWVVEKRFNIIDRAAKSYDHEVRGHYIVVADRIIAAPSIMDVIQSRWTASLLHLSNFYKAASTLPLYTIANGYHFIDAKHKKKKSKSAMSSARTSRAASPTGSISSLSRAKDGEEKNDDFEIARSFNLTLSYADEYMDENPLIGEPGSFKLSSTARSVKDKEAKEREKAAADLAKSEAAKSERARSEIGDSQKTSMLPSPTVGNAPPPLKTQGLERTKTGLGKGKSPTSAGPDGSKKKRRQSKHAVTPGVVGSGSREDPRTQMSDTLTL